MMFESLLGVSVAATLSTVSDPDFELDR